MFRHFGLLDWFSWTPHYHHTPHSIRTHQLSDSKDLVTHDSNVVDV